MPGTEEMPDVDRGTTAGPCPRGPALPERPDRRRVGARRALHPASQARRPQAHGGCARGAERDPLRAGHRLPVACLAQGPAAQEHGARPSHALGLGRHAEAAAPRLVRPGPRAGRQGGEPDGGDHRQPEREGGGKRGARIDPSGYDAGKKVKGKKRHILVDTLGLLLSAAIHPADVQDRDGAIPLLRAAHRLFPFVEVIFADGAYRGEATAAAVAGTGRWRLEIVSRGDAEGFVPLAKRWIVIARTILPRVGLVDRAGVAAAGRRGGAEDDLDPAAVDLDPPDRRPDDVPVALPVEIIEAAADLGREVLELADDQGQLPFGLGSLGRRPPSLLEAGGAGLEARDTGLELGTVEHALGVGVDQPADAAAQGGDLAVELLDLARLGGRVTGRVQAPAGLPGPAPGLLQEGAGPVPDRRLEAIAPDGRVVANGRAAEAAAVGTDAAVVAVLAPRGVPLRPRGGLAVVGVAAAPADRQALQQPTGAAPPVPLAPAVLAELRLDGLEHG